MKIDAALKERLLAVCRQMPPEERARFEKLALEAYRKAVRVRGRREGAPEGSFAEGLALAGAILHGDPEGLLEEDSNGDAARCEDAAEG